jgi:hypothetical protein
MLGPPFALANAAMGSVLRGSAAARDQLSVGLSAALDPKSVLR